MPWASSECPLHKMAALKELRRLKDEERTLMNIASKLSDQLNRLKVEELALLNMIKTQQVDPDLRHTDSEENTMEVQEQVTNEKEQRDSCRLVPLNLSVSQTRGVEEEDEQEEEEEEEIEEDEHEEETDELTRYII